MTRKKNYVVIDIEMTCEEKRTENFVSEIIEIGMVFMSYDGKITKKEQIYVKPVHSEINDYCTNLTGITKDIIKEKGISYFDATRKMIKMGLKNKTILAWGEDNKQFIKESDLKDVICPISDSFINLSLMHSMLLKTNKKYSLKDALNVWNIEPYGSLHSAVDDAYNTALVMQKMIQKFDNVI